MENVDPSSVNFDLDSSEVVHYGAVPPGTYLCRVDEARPGLTKSGHTRWGLKFVVQDGPHVGRVAAWDGLTFSPMAAARTKQVLEALGLPHEGKISLRTEDLLGREAFVTVELGEYRRPETGQLLRRNEVPYGGIMPASAYRNGDGGDRHEPSGDVDANDPSEIPF